VIATLDTNSSNACSVAAVETRLSDDSTIIDRKTSGLASFTRGTAGNITVNGSNQLVGIGSIATSTDVDLTAGGHAGATDSAVDGFKVTLDIGEDVEDDTEVIIKLPLSTAGPQNDQFYIADSSKVINISHHTAAATACDSGANVDTGATANIAGTMSGATSGNLGEIKVVLSGSVTSVSDATAADFVCVSVTNSGANATTLAQNPLVASNISTYYEIWVHAVNVGTSSAVSKTLVLQPKITDRAFTSGTAGTFIGCSSELNGMVVEFDTVVSEVDVPANYKFEINFPAASGATTFQAALGSGLTTGSDYPATVTTPSSSSTVTLTIDCSDSFLSLDTASTSAGGSVADFITVIGESGDNNDTDGGTLATAITVYTVDSGDARNIKHARYYSAGTVVAAAPATGGTLSIAQDAGAAVYDNASSVTAGVKV